MATAQGQANLANIHDRSHLANSVGASFTDTNWWIHAALEHADTAERLDCVHLGIKFAAVKKHVIRI